MFNSPLTASPKVGIRFGYCAEERLEKSQSLKMAKSLRRAREFGGDDEIRTHDLCSAIVVLTNLRELN